MLSPASEFYMPTFWNTLSVPSSKVDRCRMTMFKKCRGIHGEKRLVSKMARASMWVVALLPAL